MTEDDELSRDLAALVVHQGGRLAATVELPRAPWGCDFWACRRDQLAVPAEHGIRAHHKVQAPEHVPSGAGAAAPGQPG